jgi:uncharacterized protein (UPF0276 family)
MHLSAKQRLLLIKRINSLPQVQFEEILFALKPPGGVLPSSIGAQGMRAAGFLEWVEGPTGPGLQEVLELLQEYISFDDFGELEFDETPETQQQPVSTTTFRKGPFQAPPLPQFFVDRPEPIKAVKNLLLPAHRTPGTLVISAIYGLGGIGKSVLAQALARDEEVKAYFADGVLWATLGQKPDLLPLLGSWIQALGDFSFKPTSVDIAASHLQTLLFDKRMLLVVDDVWNSEDATPFQVGGDNCCVLITTRRADIADEAGADLFRLDLMSVEQSLEMLAGRLKRDLSESEKKSARRLAKAVGYLPIALELAASRIARGVTWSALCADLDREVARLEALEGPRRRNKGETRLEASFNLSLNALKEESLELWESFVWLGVVLEDAVIAAPMAATLWDVDVPEARDRLEFLFNESLLLAGTPLVVGEQEAWRGYRMHDLLHDIACRLLPEVQPSEDKSLAAAHRVLLEKYLRKTRNQQWHTLKEDGYSHAHLTWHMEQAEQPEAVHGLLQETTAEGRNAWYEACDALGQPAQFVSDLGRAWKLAEKSYTEDPTRSIVLQCHYGLIKTTLNTLAQNIPAELIAVFVKNGYWSVAQGLTYAQQAQQVTTKVQIIKALVPYLSKGLLPKTLELVSGIQSESSRAAALIALAEQHPELYGEALGVTREIQSESSRAAALIALAEQHPELYGEALGVTREIQSESSRAAALIALAEQHPELYGEALGETREIQSEYSRAAALRALAEQLPPELYGEALGVTREIQSEYSRAAALRALAEKLPPELYGEALGETREIQSEYSRAAALRALAEKLPPELYGEALGETREIQSESSRAAALIALAEQHPELYGEALGETREIQSESSRAAALIALAEQHPELYGEALGVTREIQDESSRADALRALAEKLPPELYGEALGVTREIQSESSRAAALIALAEQHPELYGEALGVTREIQSESSRADALIALAEQHPELYGEALGVTREIQDESSRADALRALAEKLPPELYGEALGVTREIQDESSRAAALIALAEQHPELYGEALGVTREIQDESDRAAALIALAEQHPELYGEALGVTREIQDESSRAAALRALAEKLPPELYGEALGVTREIQDESSRADALRALAEKLPPELYGEALGVTREIQSESSRADALRALAEKLPPELYGEALGVTREIQSEYSRADVLRTLLAHLTWDIVDDALWWNLQETISCQTRKHYIAHLALLEPAIVALGGEDALRGVVGAMRQVCGWWP